MAFVWLTFVDSFGDFTSLFNTKLIKGPLIVEILVVVPIEVRLNSGTAVPPC